MLASIGKEPTDVAAICCDERGRWELFIGLPGASYKSFAYNADPKGKARLPAEIVNLYKRLDEATRMAAQKGGDATREDDSKGYALVKDPEVHALEEAARSYALEHERILLRVLKSSSNAQDRGIACEVLGYARQSRRQMRALVRAARDSDNTVRNNAVRSLEVLLRSNSKLDRNIPPDTFIQMMNSGIWTDRNKVSWLLEGLTVERNPALLSKIRAEDLDSLVEMALWRSPGRAFTARFVLGRIAGVPEEGLIPLALNGPVQKIIEALSPH